MRELVARFGKALKGGKPITPLSTWRYDKEQLARKRQEQTGVDTSLIGVWSCQESCWSCRAHHYCAEKGYPQLRRYTTQCKHLYLYLDHEQYGWMNVRLQTWFPYHIQIALNGREWLRRRLEAQGVDFLRQGNKFLHIEDYVLAQRYLRQPLDRQGPASDHRPQCDALRLNQATPGHGCLIYPSPPIVAHRRSGHRFVHASRKSRRYAPADLRPPTPSLHHQETLPTISRFSWQRPGIKTLSRLCRQILFARGNK